MAATQTGPIKILVVDDEPDSLQIISRIILDDGYAVITADSGDTALAAARRELPDLVLLDVVMPIVDGFEACRRIKAEPSLQDCYVMMFSGKRLDAEDQARGLEAGADGYLTKSFVRREFLGRLNSLIRIQQTQKQLRNREVWFRSAVSNVRDGVLATDKDGRIIYMNPAAEEITGWSLQDAMDMKSEEIYRIRNDQTGERRPDPVCRVLNEGIIIGLSNHTLLFRKDGTTRFIADSAAPMRNDDKSLAGVLLVFQDVSSMREKEITLQAAFREYDGIFQAVCHPTMLLDADHRIINANQATLDLTAMSLESIRGMKCHHIYHNSDDPAAECPMTTTLQSGKPEQRDMEMAAMGRQFMVSCTPVFDETGHLKHVIHIATDITRRKQAEDKIRGALREKETLLQEVHHRVKNNMQVISSLLELQAGRAENPDVREMLRNSKNRVHAMSMVHELLYNSQDLSSIELDLFLTRLINGLFQSYRVDSGRIGCDVRVAAIRAAISIANPLGLIVNELVSNAIKYAFPGDRKGRILLELKADRGGLRLQICDDGVGLPAGIDPERSRTLGLKLVQTLAVTQLEGSLELLPGAGTCYRIHFDPGASLKSPPTSLSQ